MFQEFKKSAERLIRNIRVPQCASPFVVLFRERSGSSHLCSLLNSHPDVACRHEDFHEVSVSKCKPRPEFKLHELESGTWFRRLQKFGDEMVDNPNSKEVLAHLHDIFSCPVPASGFKFKYSIQMSIFPEVLEECRLLRNPFRIIALHRRNSLKQAISRQNMLRLRHATGSELSNLPSLNNGLDGALWIDVSDAISWARSMESQNLAFRREVERLKQDERLNVFDICYEDLFANQSQVTNEIFSFLNIEPRSGLQTEFQKVTPDKLCYAIENYDELSEAINGTELQQFLDD